MVEPPISTFIVIGAQKSATRWLRFNLGEHPDVFAAPNELHFWNNDKRVRKLGLDGYRSQLIASGGEPIVGEATPGYMIWRHHPSDVARRIKNHLPEARLIAILRNPIDRANSALMHHMRHERLPRSSRLIDVVRERTPPEKDRFCLVSGGWYAASLAPYIKDFGPQLLVLLHDDAVDLPAVTYRAALRHIGAAEDFVPRDLTQVRFSGSRARPEHRHEPTPDERIALWHYFRDDVARLEEALGRDLSHWRPTGA